jgi:hypothetical protein
VGKVHPPHRPWRDVHSRRGWDCVRELERQTLYPQELRILEFGFTRSSDDDLNVLRGDAPPLVARPKVQIRRGELFAGVSEATNYPGIGGPRFEVERQFGPPEALSIGPM